MVDGIGKSKRSLTTRLKTVCKGLRLFCKRLRPFCKRLRLFCKRLQLFAGKLIRKEILNMFKISLRQENFFATIKTVYELVCNLLQILTKSWRIQNSLRSQAFAAQCESEIENNFKVVWKKWLLLIGFGWDTDIFSPCKFDLDRNYIIKNHMREFRFGRFYYFRCWNNMLPSYGSVKLFDTLTEIHPLCIHHEYCQSNKNYCNINFRVCKNIVTVSTFRSISGKLGIQMSEIKWCSKIICC